MNYTVEALLKAYRAKGIQFFDNKRLSFEGQEGKDVYNPAYPLLLDGEFVLPARVECRNSEVSRILLFEPDKACDCWKRIPGSPSLPLQDPCWIPLGTSLLLGGVQVDFSSKKEVQGWKTVFMNYDELTINTPFFTGPRGMKDLRFCSLPNGKIALFSRPQKTQGAGRGQIGFMVLDSLKELSIEAIEQAPLLGLFAEDEWGGVNQVQVLPNGLLGILGHIACFSSDMERHYYPMTFTLDPATGKLMKEPSIILERRDLLPGPSKRPDLQDVIFPGGCVQKDGNSKLYLGVGDAEVQTVVFKNLFA
ncbi:DUF1861 family protein [uncultured Sphaerochaeta sp.]|uniref:DUF1861 family protein n=1 Tax=uncultured Sphaerochaeta sp. TaxID=886478 RepID=UPI002A0A482A|nr:DUF1861 family protein [uncultured Sphaerochaeta sp.]